MYVNVAYEIIEFANFHKFNLGDKHFVMVDLLVKSPDGEVKELNFQTFSYPKWVEVMTNGYVPIKECVPQNIMVGDYYK